MLSNTKFERIAIFNGTLFESGGQNVVWDIENLSKVSFLESDISRIRFADRTFWAEDKKEIYKISDERELEWSLRLRLKWSTITADSGDQNSLLEFLNFLGLGTNWKSIECRFEDVGNNTIRIIPLNSSGEPIVRDPEDIRLQANFTGNEVILMVNGFVFYTFKMIEAKSEKFFCLYAIRLESVIANYRNLRENYEYRLRYRESGQFFVREMELQRVYATDANSVVRKKRWLTRNFSLTAIYYHISTYGESVTKPSIIGLLILLGATLFWMVQSEPSRSSSNFIGFSQIYNLTHWTKATERAIADFLPVLQLGSNVEVGLADYIFKILGAVLTFGLLAIALRRRFERRYRH
jgi:hypothetical protein